jgi:hypothetical protein
MSTPDLAPKLGLRRRDKSRPLLSLPLTGAVPAHPPAADHLDQVPAWNGATNFGYGTCGPVDVANSAIQTWKYLLGEDLSVSDAAVFDLYRRSGNPDFDPASGAGDNGVDMTVMLAEVVRNGLDVTHADGRVERIVPLCFAAADFPPYDDLHAVTSIFGGVTMASFLTEAQQAQTDARLWDYVAGSPPWGGHATLGGAYTSATDPHKLDVSLITWMQRCGTTPGFLNHQLEEVYVIVWRPLWDHPAFQAGVDQAALAAAFTAVTNRPFPLPVPPAPVEPETFAQVWAAGKPGGVQAWCRQVRTRRDLVALKAQLQAAAHGEGLPL